MWRRQSKTQVPTEAQESDSTADDGEISGGKRANGDESKVQSQVRCDRWKISAKLIKFCNLKPTRWHGIQPLYWRGGRFGRHGFNVCAGLLSWLCCVSWPSGLWHLGSVTFRPDICSSCNSNASQVHVPFLQLRKGFRKKIFNKNDLIKLKRKIVTKI